MGNEGLYPETWNYMLLLDLLSLAGIFFARIFVFGSYYIFYASCMTFPMMTFLSGNILKGFNAMFLTTVILIGMILACIVGQEILMGKSLKRRFYDE